MDCNIVPKSILIMLLKHTFYKYNVRIYHHNELNTLLILLPSDINISLYKTGSITDEKDKDYDIIDEYKKMITANNKAYCSTHGSVVCSNVEHDLWVLSLLSELEFVNKDTYDIEGGYLSVYKTIKNIYNELKLLF